MKKNNKTYFGYKIHTKQDMETQLILDFKLTKANIHDSKINLCKSFEVDYKDKAYFKQKYKQNNGAMTRAVRNGPLNIWEKLRNKRITRKRAPVERPYSFLDRINNSHTKLTTIERNEIPITILMILFNTEQLITLKKQKENKKKNVNEENEIENHDNNLSFKFFNNNTIYYENQPLINFLIQKSTNKEIIKAQKNNKKTKNSKNTISMSKSEYRRKTKRKLKKIRKQKQNKIKKQYQQTIKSLNEFHLTIP
jgi:hypothetical protein